MKPPDFFYIKQAQALDRFHDLSIRLLESFGTKNNPNNAYDTDWGSRQLDILEASFKIETLNPQILTRVMRQRTQPTGFLKRPELDRDMLRIEHIIENIEQEQALVFRKRMEILTVWNAAAWLFILTALFWYAVL